MNKDVIYIDVEDDITAIISKVKQAKERVVALVPPKRIGVLQSAVNLRLLARAAENSDKRLVLISSSQQLQSLAAAAQIPFAKNLQTKPMIPQIAELDADSGDEIIDGATLPVGELAQAVDNPQVDIDDSSSVDNQSLAPAAVAATKSQKPGKKSKSSKVPDFNRFRKKFVIFGLLGALLVGFLIWAIWFAPRATIVVSARTTESLISTRANLSSGQATDFDTATIKADVKETSKDTTVEFAATGEEERGDRATGTMTLTQAGESSATDVPAGTSFSSGEFTYVTNEFVRVPGARVARGAIVPGTVDVSVTATNIGADYNLPARAYQSSIAGVSARGGQMSGGSKEIVKVVTAADMQAAREKLVDQNADAVKAQLKDEFDNKAKVIDGSFVSQPEEPKSSVEVGAESKDGKATLTSRVHYRLSAISEADLEKFLEQAIESRLSSPDEQRVYETGVEKAALNDFKSGDEGDSIAVTANGQVGPKIDEDEIKSQSAGKRYGEVQSTLESISGVSDVDIQFWPFWVSAVPNDVDRISIEFKIENNE